MQEIFLLDPLLPPPPTHTPVPPATFNGLRSYQACLVSGSEPPPWGLAPMKPVAVPMVTTGQPAARLSPFLADPHFPQPLYMGFEPAGLPSLIGCTLALPVAFLLSIILRFNVSNFLCWS